MSVVSKLPGSEPGREGTVLLLPGMSLNATIFPHLPADTVTVDFNAFRPKVNRTGPMAERAGGGPWMDAYISELDRQLDASAWPDAGRRIVVGHSFGGMLALAWWLHHQGTRAARIDGLVLAATTAGPMYDAVRLRLVPGSGAPTVRVGIAPLMRLWNSRIVTRAVHRLLSGGRTRTLDFQRLKGRGDIAVGLAGWQATAWPARRGYRLAMWGFDVRNRLPEIHVPAIILYGTEDYLFPVERGKALARGIPQADLRIIDGAGHVLPLSHGEAIVRAVTDLLGT